MKALFKAFNFMKWILIKTLVSNTGKKIWFYKLKQGKRNNSVYVYKQVISQFLSHHTTHFNHGKRTKKRL